MSDRLSDEQVAYYAAPPYQFYNSTQLAEALRDHPALRGFPEVVAALAAWEASRHE